MQLKAAHQIAQPAVLGGTVLLEFYIVEGLIAVHDRSLREFSVNLLGITVCLRPRVSTLRLAPRPRKPAERPAGN